ncbi:MAG: hypothetical protein LC685_04175 [Actinobacteria bacterium]|nr:hypothetical protein [Actinomycetota bacterium]
MREPANPRAASPARRVTGHIRARLEGAFTAEAVPIALFLLWSLLPALILTLWIGGRPSSVSAGSVFTGADQLDVPDQLQYIAWIRDAAEHVLSSNRFDLAPDPHLYLHPMFVLSGLAWKAGASLQVAYLAWRPVAVVVIVLGFAAYVRRLVPPDRWMRAGALGLALFFATPAWAISGWGHLGSARTHFGLQVMGLEMFPGAYSSIGIVFGLMPLFLLGVEQLLDPARRRDGRSTASYAIATALAGALVSWLHPWQGLTLLAIVLGTVCWMRLWRQAVSLVVPVAATAAPFAYYFALSHTHSAWQASSQPNGYPHLGPWFLLAILPPLLLAAPGFRGRDIDLQARMARLWPIAALLVYFALDRSWFYHAVAGIGLPLAVLAIPGLRRVGASPAVTGLAIAAFTVPGAALYVKQLNDDAATHFLPAGEDRALRTLARSRVRGGVLARPPLGTAVPAFSGRSTWVGHPLWTPDFAGRRAQADALFGGRLAARPARGLVLGTHARFVLADCRSRANLGALLGPLVASTRRFGCAVLYELR